MKHRLNITTHAQSQSIAPLYDGKLPENAQGLACLLVNLTCFPLEIHALNERDPLVKQWHNCPGRLQLALHPKVLESSLYELAYDALFSRLLESLRQQYCFNPNRFKTTSEMDLVYSQHILDNLPQAVVQPIDTWLASQINLEDFVATGDVRLYANAFSQMDTGNVLLVGDLLESMHKSLLALVKKEQQHLETLPLLLSQAQHLLWANTPQPQ